jgi:phytoene synthase
MAAIYQTLLDEMEADEFRVMQHRLRLTPLRKFWIAWTTARKEHRWHRKHLKNTARART